VSLSANGSQGLSYDGPAEGRVVTLAMLTHLGLEHVRISLAGDLPLAAGLGSSAALAVAIVRATGVSDPDEVRVAAHQLEQIAHGRASGIDDAVISYGTPLLFRPDAPPGARFIKLAFPAPPFWVAWVPRICSTKESVARVATMAAAEPTRFGALVAATTRIVSEGEGALRSGGHAQVGRLMNEAQAILDEIGVVVDSHRKLCELGMRAGALGAKTTGAGGGGAVMFLGPAEMELDRVLAAAGFGHSFFAGEPH